MTDNTEKNIELILALEEARGALALIGMPPRPDGTYNRDRAACGDLARQTLSKIKQILEEGRSAEVSTPTTPTAATKAGAGATGSSVSAGAGRGVAAYTIYTDGGCHGNPGPAGCGVVVLQGGQVVHEGGFFIGKATNQVAELTAAIKGLQMVPEGSHVELVSDSQYTLKGISEWRKGWERNNWVNSANKPVANMAVWKELFSLVDARKVSTRWVRGHNGDTHNERCDVLANEAITNRSMAKLQSLGMI